MSDYMPAIAQGMCDEILELIHKYDDAVPVALALGVLEIVKAQLIDEALDKNDGGGSIGNLPGDEE